MKFFKKRSATAFMLALAMMSTSVAPAFAEGSKELNTVPDDYYYEDKYTNTTTDAAEYLPHRAYFDWRDRDQFGMPSKNVVYAYANAGETIFFGSAVTEANDASISAVVHDSSMWNGTNTLNGKVFDFTGTGLAGRSIAVTLPVSEGGDAFNPEVANAEVSTKYNTAGSIFVDGAGIETATDREKVYLFDVVPNGAGHIANPDMEQAGPDINGTNTEGYEPLSFVAPYTGTYSFRFLSREYAHSDQPLPEETREDYREMISIDFDGVNQKPDLGRADAGIHTSYYEEGIGEVTLYNDATRGGKPRGVTVAELSASVNVPATDYAKATTYAAGEKYVYTQLGMGQTSTGGSVGFVPLHDNVEIEIVWGDRGEGGRRIYADQDDNGSGQITGATETVANGVHVTRISSIRNGGAIKAGKELRIYIVDNYKNADNKDRYNSTDIYEIRYYYDRTEAPCWAPSPSPEPLTQTVSLDALTVQTYNKDQSTSLLNDAVEVNAYSTVSKNYSVSNPASVTVGGTSYTGKFLTLNAQPNTGNSFSTDSLTDGKAVVGTTGSAIEIIPKHKDAYIDIVASGTQIYAYHSAWNENQERLTNLTDAGKKITLSELTPSVPVYLYTGSGTTNIYEITYHYRPENAETAGVSAVAETAMFLADSTTVEPKPVSNSYTWDFYQMKGDESTETRTKYTTEAIVGNYDHGDGTDYDSSYDYDLKVYATNDKAVGINNQALDMNAGAVWDDFTAKTGPKAGILEMIPEWDGTVEAVFETLRTGTINVYQPNSTNAVKEVLGIAEGARSFGGASLNVTAGEPVYIYAEGNVYLKSVKYTANESTVLERTLDEKWATTGSEVAAWDVTVASTNGDIEDVSWNAANSVNCKMGDQLMSGLFTLFDNVEDNGSYIQAGNEYNGTWDSTTNTASGGALKYIASADGILTIKHKLGNDKTRYVKDNNGNDVMEPYKNTTGETQELEIAFAVEAGKTYYIFGTGTKIGFMGASFEAYDYTKHNGRVWTDILFLNAGNYKRSLYSNFNVLTKEGFLYDVKLNGIQPYSFVFYSNNRGFLFDRWSLYSDPERSLGEGAVKWYDYLQSLEHSFYSYTSGSDVGDAPVHIERDGNNNPITYNDNVMQSAILGNYIPVDKDKDATHKIFFNEPDGAAMQAYTGDTEKKEITATNLTGSESFLNNIKYVGLGNNAANLKENTGVNYGTIGVGGKFIVTVSADEAAKLNSLGSNSINITLDFTMRDLETEEGGSAPVPVLDTNNEWAKLTAAPAETDPEYNNKVSLSTVIDTATTTNKEYILSWDGRDAYGNVVPQGEYSQVVKAYAEMGMAHFPFLDAEHNPNGIKIKMLNEIAGNDLEDYVYYNNEAVSPKENDADPSAWYYNGWASNTTRYPSRIGDGKNMISGTKSNFDDSSALGAMPFGEYQESEEGDLNAVYAGLNKGSAGGDGGYGNYAAIDVWSKYEVKAAAEMSIGVNPISVLRPYVSFVAVEGQNTGRALPFQTSHIGYGGDLVEEIPDNKGLTTVYGNTISTGFVSSVTTTTGAATDYVKWEITIPVNETVEYSEGTETKTKTVETFIKRTYDTEEGTLTTAEDIDQAAAETYDLMYSSLFEDYAIADGGNDLGDEYVPDWEADASLNESGDTGIMDLPTNFEDMTEEALYDEASYIEEISLLGETEGEYKNSNWSVALKLTDPVDNLVDPETVQVNKGDIRKVEQIGGDTAGKAKVTLQYKLPTTVSGTGTVTIGLVIDNLYAPGARATASYNTGSFGENLHDITSKLFDGGDALSVQSRTYSEYATNDYNEYFTGVNNPVISIEFEGLDAMWGTASIDTTTTYATIWSHRGGRVDSVYNGAMFGFNNVDITGLTSIDLMTGTNHDNATATVYAIPVANIANNDLAAMTEDQINALISAGTAVELGKTSLKNTGSYTTREFNNLAVSNAPTGKVALIVKAGSKGEYVADFDYMQLNYTRSASSGDSTSTVPEAQDYVWTYTEKYEGCKTGSELMTGLTTLFDDTDAESNALASSDNGKFENGVATGTALKYEAWADGTLSVSVKKLGSDKTLYIVSSDGTELATIKGTGAAETISAPVVNGGVYYIYGAGTKATFNGASFAPKVEFENWSKKWVTTGYGKETDLSSASGGQVVDSTVTNDTFYFGEVDMNSLSKIELIAGTDADEQVYLDFYAIDTSTVDLATVTQSEILEKLADNKIGTIEIQNDPAGDWNAFMTHTLNVADTTTGTKGLFAVCRTVDGNGYCGNFDYMNLYYN